MLSTTVGGHPERTMRARAAFHRSFPPAVNCQSRRWRDPGCTPARLRARRPLGRSNGLLNPGARRSPRGAPAPPGAALGPGNRLEAPGRNRLPALDRETVGAVLEPFLGALDALQLVAQLHGEGLVDLLLLDHLAVVGQVRGGVDFIELTRSPPLQVGERALDPPALACGVRGRGRRRWGLPLAHLLISPVSALGRCGWDCRRVPSDGLPSLTPATRSPCEPPGGCSPGGASPSG